MRKKEIEGFVQAVAVKAFEEGNFGDVPFWRDIPTRPSGEYQKAKLVIEAKESQVTITESQFEKLISGDHWQDIGNLRRLKQKLFGKDAG